MGCNKTHVLPTFLRLLQSTLKYKIIIVLFRYMFTSSKRSENHEAGTEAQLPKDVA